MIRSHFNGDAPEQADIQKRQFSNDAVRRVIIHFIDSSGKTLIRYLAMLCVIHAGHRFDRLYINTTWDELSSEWTSCLGANFLWGELSWGELSSSLRRVLLFPPVNAHLVSGPTINTKTNNAKFDLVVK